MGRKIGRRRAEAKEKTEKTVDLGCQEFYRIEVPEGSGICIGKLHGIGKREKQQDAFGVSDVNDVKTRGILFVLADGMGGLSGGEIASTETVVSCLSYFDNREIDIELEEYFVDMLEYANERVIRALDCDAGDGGSTVVAVWIWENYMFYISVGDSRIMFYRDGELTKLNREHNYGASLLERAMRGEITPEEAYNDPQKNALTSYIGEPSVSEMDVCAKAVKLCTGDKIILMSDGVYRTVTEEEMEKIFRASPQKAAKQLEQVIFSRAKASQDNYTALIVEMISEEKKE